MITLVVALVGSMCAVALDLMNMRVKSVIVRRLVFTLLVMPQLRPRNWVR